MLNPIKNYFQRRGTRVSALAQLSDVQYDETTAIRPLVKSERSVFGKCTSVGSMSAVYDTTIGNFCSLARECYIGGAAHPLDRVSTSGCFYLPENYTGVCYNEDRFFQWRTETTIGNDVWLGARVMVLAGIHISDGAVIGGGSVVTHDVGPYEIWAGNPARFIRKRFDDESIKILLESKWWDWPDDKLKSYGRYFTDINKFIQMLKYKPE